MTERPLVSVIITAYNHAHYLPQSIQSALSQDYENKEIVVIDDGSTDATKAVVAAYPGVKYVYQENRGLSAARNSGIENSSGEFLTFLDADDWFFPGALSSGANVLVQCPQAAFVYGTYETVNDENEILPERRHKQDYTDKHYLHLLESNFIAMHATVLYRRWAFSKFQFDTGLPACEDYDLYLKIVRDHPVVYHPAVVAAYRRHGHNMSGNIPLMLSTVLRVLERQWPVLRTPEEKGQWHKGNKRWKDFYGCILLWHLQRSSFFVKDPKLQVMRSTLVRYNKKLFLSYLRSKFSMGIKSLLKNKAPAPVLSFLHKAGVYKSYRPATGKINRGDFSTEPFSRNFGYDRGGPVDRYYIENFLEANAAVIRGRVLEIGDNEYTLRFGGEKVTQSDVLHVEAGNAKATFVGDLSDAPHLPSDAFDCIVLTQTLHLIYRHVEALQTCFRVLKHGGTLLLTSPGITHIDQYEWRDYWYWSYTQTALNRLLSEAFPAGSYQTEAFGNVLVATAFLHGMGQPELSKAELDKRDLHYQVIITARATKP